MFRISCFRPLAFGIPIPLRLARSVTIPPPQPSLLFPSRPSPPSILRQLTSSAFRQAAIPQLSKAPPPLRHSKPLKPLDPALSPKPYALSPTQHLTQALRDAGDRVVLYLGPNHRVYRFVCWVSGTACALLICYTLSLAVDESGAVPLFTRFMMSVISVAFMLLTWFFFSSVRGLVSRVTAYTRPVPRTDRLETELEVRIRSVVPFFRERVYRVAPEQVRISACIVPAKPRTLQEQEAYATMMRWLKEEERVRRTSFFRAPLRKTSYACHCMLRNTRYALTKELMVRMYIRADKKSIAESIFKFDSTGKFAQEYKLLEPLITKHLPK